MRKLIGILVGIAGFIVAAYVGVYLMLVGGLIQIVEAVKLEDIPADQIAIGAARIIFTGLVFWIVFIAFGFIASLIAGD